MKNKRMLAFMAASVFAALALIVLGHIAIDLAGAVEISHTIHRDAIHSFFLLLVAVAGAIAVAVIYLFAVYVRKGY